jgi:hypothetical protein
LGAVDAPGSGALQARKPGPEKMDDAITRPHMEDSDKLTSESTFPLKPRNLVECCFRVKVYSFKHSVVKYARDQATPRGMGMLSRVPD